MTNAVGEKFDSSVARRGLVRSFVPRKRPTSNRGEAVAYQSRGCVEQRFHLRSSRERGNFCTNTRHCRLRLTTPEPARIKCAFDIDTRRPCSRKFFAPVRPLLLRVTLKHKASRFTDRVRFYCSKQG